MNNFSILIYLVFTLLIAGCSASSVQTSPATLGNQASMQDLHAVAGQAGPITFTKVAGANWQVPLSGMLNLNHPKAIAAGLADRKEPIQLFVYLLQHPKYGNFIIDSGVSESFIDAANNPDISWLVKKAMDTATIEVLQTTQSLSSQLDDTLRGVFLTHIHLDHIMGLKDIKSEVPVYLGAGDPASSALMHAATRGSTDRLLGNVDQLKEWRFDASGVLDVFGDGSLWAIHSPGHSPGSTAYLVNSTGGPQLVVGDVSHTRWGWDNGVEPGSYSIDSETGIASLKKLKQLVQQHPSIVVHPGHQP